jgi:hypothetical protein
MKLAIMQPYFFPNLGYFSLIANCDEFIIFDTPQYMRKGWVERNRIIKAGGGSVYIKVPLIKSALNTPINNMVIDNSQLWKDKIIAQLGVYNKKAPNYYQIMKLVSVCLEGEFENIADLNEKVLRTLCNYLNITTKITVYSKLNLEIKTPKAADEWALNICNTLSADSYINAQGGQHFFNSKKYHDCDIDLGFIKNNLGKYTQLGGEFEPNLSIIDALMFNSVPQTNNLILDVEIINA